ncbi:MAG: UDP-N-acetylmuramate dehydrogenase [Verrucomicrobia bacterium]|nr:UDP-N-acetylmuramate dehydrogenase [Verrucomicrobiota bacterium]
MMTIENPSIADALAGRLSSGTVIKHHEPMAKHTTLRVGGPADVYIEPATENDLAAILKYCQERGAKFFLLGRGSNLVVRDGGFRGVVICLAHAHFSRVEIDGLHIHAGAGAKQKTVAVEAKRNSLTGVEFLEGIPGSIGGALRMNAGAMGGETFNAVETVRVMDYAGNISEMKGSEMSVTYRCCATLKDHIALSAVFKCTAQPREEIEKRMKAYSQKRWDSQPAAPSAGCMFKNPAGIPAGKLIEELGMKGSFVGGAMVSLEHGNFLVNGGMATAKDVLELIANLQAKAKAERGIELHTEVEVIGE